MQKSWLRCTMCTGMMCCSLCLTVKCVCSRRLLWICVRVCVCYYIQNYYIKNVSKCDFTVKCMHACVTVCMCAFSLLLDSIYVCACVCVCMHVCVCVCERDSPSQHFLCLWIFMRHQCVCEYLCVSVVETQWKSKWTWLYLVLVQGSLGPPIQYFLWRCV